jgi:hypothetical protein
MASPFGNLGLSELGSEAKYASNPETVPGFIQGAVAIPKAYMAQNWLKPAVEWLENKLSPVPPPAVSPLSTSPAAPVVLGAPVDANADHPLLDGLTKSNPY